MAYTAQQFLSDANKLLPRTQCDPDPVTNVTYALTRLRHHGLAGEQLRQRYLGASLSRSGVGV